MLQTTTFAALDLAEPLMRAISDLCYEIATPVQSLGIPILREGHDLVAQAQTGTGKTAVFALPILEKLNLKQTKPQALVLAPTRELAIQVAQAFESYAKYIPGFHVAAIYGGQDYSQQLNALKRGVHVVVGTPGRVMDHMRRGTLMLDNIKTVILDEADEMLRIGFLEDVEWILERIPQEHQSALFSATMPASIQAIAKNHLINPKQVKIKSDTMAASGILQSAMLLNSKNKLEALTRYLEVEEFDGVLVFVRTKNQTTELADKIIASGFSAAALNGDMKQRERERVIKQVKTNAIDIIVATDVAARGLDVERLSHVVNYDAPFDVETYVHRIGRTGRAGRIGKSLLMITPREQRYLRTIERTTNQIVKIITPPTIQEINDIRMQSFTAQILDVVEQNNLDHYRKIVEKIIYQSRVSLEDIAAALVKIARKGKILESSGDDLSVLDKSEEPSKKRKDKRRFSRSKRRFNNNQSRPHGKAKHKSAKEKSNKKRKRKTNFA